MRQYHCALLTLSVNICRHSNTYRHTYTSLDIGNRSDLYISCFILRCTPNYLSGKVVQTYYCILLYFLTLEYSSSINLHWHRTTCISTSNSSIFSDMVVAYHNLLLWTPLYICIYVKVGFTQIHSLPMGSIIDYASTFNNSILSFLIWNRNVSFSSLTNNQMSIYSSFGLIILVLKWCFCCKYREKKKGSSLR